MREQTNRARVSVALVGVGPTWDLHYRAAVERLSTKLSVRAVCDPVHVRAVAVAEEFQATAVCSPWLLAQRKDLHAWLILDPGWLNTYPAELAASTGRPALLANPFSASFPKLKALFRRSLESGETLMPEFPERYTPATVRLRELTATRLGRIHRIEVAIPAAAPCSITNWLRQSPSQTVEILDWCAYIVGRRVHSARIRSSADGEHLQFSFSNRDAIPSDSLNAVIKTIPAPTDSFALRTVHCEHGSATVSGPTSIEWVVAGQPMAESLENERSPYEIVLDQFCRRALGGLLPVPTLKDALDGIAAAELAVAEIEE